MEVVNIVLFKGESGYGALSHFSEALSEALSEHGTSTQCLDLTLSEFQINWGKLFDEGLLACIGFNATGLDLQAHGMNLFDSVGLPFIGLLVDHPMHLQQRLQTPMVNLVLGMIEENHTSSLKRLCGLYRPSFHFPLAATQTQATLSPAL
jgi:hypothetical protein